MLLWRLRLSCSLAKQCAFAATLCDTRPSPVPCTMTQSTPSPPSEDGTVVDSVPASLPTECLPLLPSTSSHTQNTPLAHPPPRQPSVLTAAVLAGRRGLEQLLSVCTLRPYTTALALLTVAVVFGHAVYLASSISSMLSLLVDISLTRVDVTHWTESGVELLVLGAAIVDYAAIRHWYPRMLAHTVGLLLGEVRVEPLLPVEVFVQIPSSSPHKPLLENVVSVVLPPLAVNMAHRSRLRFFIELVVAVHPAQATRALNHIMDPASANTLLEVRLHINARLATTSRSLGCYSAWVSRTWVPLSQSQPPVRISHITASDSHDGTLVEVSCEVAASVWLPLWPEFRAKVPKLSWEVSVPGCAAEWLPVLYANTSSFAASPSAPGPWTVDIEAQVPLFGSALTTPCNSSQGSSPLGRWMAQAAASHPVSVSLRGVLHQHPSVPPWLTRVLANSNFPPVRVPTAAFLTPSVPTVLLGLASAQVPALLGDTLVVVSHANASFAIQRPHGINVLVEVPLFGGEAQIEYNSLPLAQVRFPRWQQTAGNVFGHAAISLHDTQVVVGANMAETAGLALNDWLSGHNVTLGIVAAGSARAKTTVGEVGVDDCSVGVNMSLPALHWQDMVGNALRPQVTLILVVRTTPHSLEIECVVEMHNPLSVEVAISPGLELLVGDESQTVFGRAAMALGVRVRPGAFNSTVRVLLDPAAYNRQRPDEARTRFDNFTSLYLSGNLPLVLVRGVPGSAKALVPLDGIVSRLQAVVPVPDVLVPGSAGSQDSRFIVRAVMHIMTLEVELEVYNPLANENVVLTVFKARASHDGHVLGYLEHPAVFTVPPGTSTTPRVPVRYAQGIGGDTLRKALNGRLQVHCEAVANVTVGVFLMQVMYEGGGVGADVRL